MLAVIGGGDVAIDVARSAIRLGAKKVTIACLESREAMPALPWELEDAIAEGAGVLPSVAVRKFLMHEGRVAGFEAIRVKRIVIDANGRIAPETEPGRGFEVAADTIVVAIGSRSEPGVLPPGASRKLLDAAHHVYRLIFKEKEIRIPAYACGDVVSGPGTVVEASASGRAAALNIYEALCVEEVRKARFEDNYRRVAEPHVSDRPEWRKRRRAQRLSPEESRRTFQEVEKGLTEEDVHHEAVRCARCNLWL